MFENYVSIIQKTIFSLNNEINKEKLVKCICYDGEDHFISSIQQKIIF